ncbi:MAG: AAA family ATPase [Bacteroidota bacterium]
MARLRLQHIGPIKEGFVEDDGWLDFKKVTVFIGGQGSGKSTVAKVYSTLSWIEKALVRGDFSEAELMVERDFLEFFNYQGLRNYFREPDLLSKGSSVQYQGDAVQMAHRGGPRLSEMVSREGDHFHFPKIMYVPAERNFVATVDRPDLIKRLPLPLYTFLDEYEAAKQHLSGPVKLPVGGVSFEFNPKSGKSVLAGDGFYVNLLEASSGFQSLVPLVLVTRFLSDLVLNARLGNNNLNSLAEVMRMREEIAELYRNPNLSEAVRGAALARISARFGSSSFLNIVEEPEQNLFPSSQKEILFELLRCRSKSPENQLVITTHSPYIINYLTLAVKAHHLWQKMGHRDAHPLADQLAKIVPPQSAVSPQDVAVYQIDDQGQIRRLPDYQGIPADSNYLNNFLMESNILFDQLLEIEEEL